MAEIVRQLVFPVLNTGRKEITLDLDSFPHEVHGHQPGTAYNAHYRTRCFHPLVASVDGRYFLGAELREGNVHTADGGLDFVLPLLRWLRTFVPRVWLRADAGFPAPHLLGALEKEGIPYVCRIRSNAALERLAAPFLHAPSGTPERRGAYLVSRPHLPGRQMEARPPRRSGRPLAGPTNSSTSSSTTSFS